MKQRFYGIKITDEQSKELSLKDRVRVTITGSVMEMTLGSDMEDLGSEKGSEKTKITTIEVEADDVKVEDLDDNEFSTLAESESA